MQLHKIVHYRRHERQQLLKQKLSTANYTQNQMPSHKIKQQIGLLQ